MKLRLAGSTPLGGSDALRVFTAEAPLRLLRDAIATELLLWSLDLCDPLAR